MKKATPEKHPLPRASLVWTAHAFTRATDNASVCTCKLRDADGGSVLKGVVVVARISMNLDVNETTTEGAFSDTTHPKPCCRTHCNSRECLRAIRESCAESTGWFF